MLEEQEKLVDDVINQNEQTEEKDKVSPVVSLKVQFVLPEVLPF